MRRRVPLAVASVLLGSALVGAQERIPLPTPDPTPPGAAAVAPPQTLQTPPAPAPGPSSPPPPGGYAGPGYLAPPYPPPPGGYPGYPPPGGYPGYPPPPPGYAGPGYPPPPVFLGDPAGNPSFWIGAEALLWWTKNPQLSVPLLTTGPASQGANAGNLGAPGTQSLDGPLSYGAEGGFRLYAGGWFNASHTFGMDGSLFWLGQQSAGFGANDRSGTGATVINEPVANAPYITQVSAPGVGTGYASVDSTSRLWGGDVNLLYNAYRNNGLTVNLLGGFRYLQLNETLSISGTSTLFTATTYTDGNGDTLASAPAGSNVVVYDSFHTRNEFYGGQIGASAQYLMGRLFFGGDVKLAVGATHQVVDVNGTTTVFPTNSSPVPLTGGNYATLQIGRYSMDRFAVAPSTQLNVGYQFTPWLRGMVGYNFLYLSSVVRPGPQIDNSFDGVIHPLVPMVQAGYWAQGVNFSLQFSF
jgi:hypothetical protein